MNRTALKIGAAAVLACLMAMSASPARAAGVAEELQGQFITTAKKVDSAVVNVAIKRKARMADRASVFPDFFDQFGDDPMFKDFFRFHNQPDQGDEGSEPELSSAGSGVIVDGRGYILTNNHVVENADEIQVTLVDGSEHSAELVGNDPGSDLAVLKIEADGLKPIAFGDSDRLQVGQWVMAVGNPFGLEHSVTVGIVSAVGRSIDSLNRYEDFIQTDAAINPGNSGGALVDLEGNLVGINSAIFTQGGGNLGIGFAIPVNAARRVYDQLVEFGKVARGWLGVGIQDLNEALQKKFGVKEGVLVTELIDDNSPAGKAGIKHGDVIVAYNGEETKTTKDLAKKVAKTAVNDTATIEALRDGKKMTFQIKVGERPVDEDLQAGGSSKPKTSDKGELGLTLEEVPKGSDNSPAGDFSGGLLVRAIQRGSRAGGEGGLQVGDLIVEVESRPTPDLKAFRKALEEVGAKNALLFRIYRSNSPLYIAIGEAKEEDGKK